MIVEDKNNEIVLKLLEPKDAGLLFGLIDKNRDHLSPWFYWVDRNKTSDDTLKFLNEEKEKYEKKTGAVCGIWFKGGLAGVISLERLDMETKTAMIGYWLDKNHQGKGIMTSSCRLLITYCFKTLKLHRIEILHIVENEKSKAVIKRLGFVYEGRMREATYVNGKYYNDDFYSILEHEWKE